MKLALKVADCPEELEQIFRLNHQTFVEEIPQHAAQASGQLKDAFHDHNTYLIAKLGTRVVGMTSIAKDRPFSLDRKLANLDTYLPLHHQACEIRLLAIDPTYRGSRLFLKLLKFLYEFAESQHHDLALISGTVRQLPLYQKLGFVAFGPLVGTDKARYQPMFLTLNRHQTVRNQYAQQ